MIRRDEFLQRLHEFNNSKFINTELENLEKFVDQQLLLESNIILMINSITAGTNGTNGEEYVLESIATNSVHKDFTTDSENKVTINGIAYSIFDDDDAVIETSNGEDATTTPWDDITIAESDQFDGSLEIELPENTNKMIARKLTDKYLKVDDFDTDGEPSSGFWGSGLKPNDSSNNNVSVDVPDAVTLRYEPSTNTIFMIFKLF